MTKEIYFLLLLFIVLFGFILDKYLVYLNVNNWQKKVPEELQDVYDQEKYSKARNYQLVNTRFSLLSGGFSLILTIVVLATGFLGELDNKISLTFEGDFKQSAFFFLTLILGADIVSLPFALYGTFKIEQRFGFNKTTIPTFILDKLKSYILMAILGGPILFALMYFYAEVGQYFWLYAWGLLTGFMLLTTKFYTSFILPIFSKLKPLEAGELRSAIEEYCLKVGYDLKRIYTMNGSKRSTKGNAFFSGMGKQKTIVLYDTLINQHTTEELVAILAHEVGHYKKKHTTQGLLLGIFQTGIMLFLLSLFLNDLNLAKALGAQRTSFHLGLIGFFMIYTPLSMVSGIFMNSISRKNEFEADAFAKSTYGAEPLISGLKNLSAQHLSNPSPHPAYVFVNYSHPPLLERINALHS